MKLKSNVVLLLILAAGASVACKKEQQQEPVGGVSPEKAAMEAKKASMQGVKKDKPVGASLHKKQELAVADIPKEVLAVVRQARPKAQITGAEKEWKHGKTYIDVEAKDEQGAEIEFDLLQTEKGWKIAEVQRDLAFKDVPKPVSESLLAKHPGAKPARVIESDQGDGVIVYEFFLVAADKSEKKHEVKFEAGKATLLKTEWKH